MLDPAHEPVALAPSRPGTGAERHTDYRQALAWFEAEHQVLLATIALGDSTGFAVHAWQLPWAMAAFLPARGHYQEAAATQRTALAAATRLGDTAGQAVSSRLLAIACTDLGDHDQARPHLAHALDLYRRLGNRLGEGKTHLELGRAAEYQGRYADALAHAEQALRLYQASGHRAAEADALNDVGWSHALLGDHQQARAFCQQALALSAEVGDRSVEGYPGTASVTPSIIWATSAKPPPATSARCASHRKTATAASKQVPHPPWRHPPRRRRAAPGPAGLAAGTGHVRGHTASQRRPGPRQARQRGEPGGLARDLMTAHHASPP